MAKYQDCEYTLDTYDLNLWLNRAAGSALYNGLTYNQRQACSEVYEALRSNRRQLSNLLNGDLPEEFYTVLSVGAPQDSVLTWAQTEDSLDLGGCTGPDPVAEDKVLTLMRLIVSASGNSELPPQSMAKYWNATTLPTVRAAAQALLDFKAAVDF